MHRRDIHVQDHLAPSNFIKVYEQDMRGPLNNESDNSDEVDDGFFNGGKRSTTPSPERRMGQGSSEQFESGIINI